MQRLLSRAIWLKIHLYLALIAGFFFALIGLTGSVSIYREELDMLLNPRLVIEQPLGKRLSLDKMMAAVRAAHPDRHGAWTLEMPRSAHGMVTVWYDKPRETFFELYAPLMVSVNPYTAEVVASRFWGQTLTTWLLDLHTQLQLNRFGWNAVGIVGVLLMLSIGTGVYLWWPGIPNILGALKIRHKAGLVRLAFDLHRLAGLLSAAVLLLLAFTGFHLSYPAVLETLAGASGMEHGGTGRTIISTAIPNNHPVSLESAEFLARGPFPRAELRRVTTPAGDSGIYRINLRQSSEINRRHPYTTVWVDRWSGHIKEVRDPSGFTSGEVFASWIWPVHTGEAFGAGARFIWFVAGFVPLLLYVTGLLHWLHRHGKVNDREVSLAALRPLFARLKKWGHRTALMLFRLGNLLLGKAKYYAPIMLKNALALWQWLRLKVMMNRQKRIGR
ncbi:MAG: PepSY-associated TM helix domain-containing protein [Methylobacter sp.]|nr:PepSY-associated TM helix domain-containing protein [Methylobacter sp.]MDP2099319.1 PepSY-associated TM helix domain-containing protein [Methylobacter sp.]MDP2428489.1 PepSY-associated TM helix domain-containing protein [Methylobacter sp.]MDP3055180.1 PepSY-associated TM helix domain-containing protein [Methylobacter sp.]MDP3363680.1 PepSY-associated TM helix domain-containing protein [Methylobacter sp.]